MSRLEGGAHRSTSRSLNPRVVLSEKKQRHPTEINNPIERSGLRRGEMRGVVCSLLLFQNKEVKMTQMYVSLDLSHILLVEACRGENVLSCCSQFKLRCGTAGFCQIF